jgi:hypothetical protein
MRRRFASRLLVIGSAFVALMLVASPAHADGYDVAKEHGPFGHDGPCRLIQVNAAAEVSFCQPGDVFHLWDMDNDGKSVGVKWHTSYGRSGLCRWAGGAPDMGDCNYDFRENTTVTFSAGLCNQTATVDCRTWDDYTAKHGPTSISTG